MNYIEKLFKQHPFIYYINGKYYAFGVNACAECSYDAISLKNRYDAYLKVLEDGLMTDVAWDVFEGRKLEAKFIADHDNNSKKFEDFKFNQEEMKILEKQIEDYVKFFSKNNLHKYI